MNEADLQLLMPDQYRYAKERSRNKLKKFGALLKVVVILAVISMILMVYSITSNSSQQAADLKTMNSEIVQKNAQTLIVNSKLEQQITELDSKSLSLSANITKLQTEVDITNRQISDIQANVGENCNAMRQRLRLNQTGLNELQISVLPTIPNTNTPIIVSLNISNNNLIAFSDNSLPNVEVLDITSNPVSNFSNNDLTSLTDLFISRSGNLYSFNDNNFLKIESLDLYNSGLTSFKNNKFANLKQLSIGLNKIVEFSNYNISSLQTIELWLNPLSAIRNNSFPKLAKIDGIEDIQTLTRVTNNYFGQIKSFSLQSMKEIVQFQNNIFPQLTTLSFNKCTYDYAKITRNSMPLLKQMTIINSNLSNFQYFAQFRLLTALSMKSLNIKSFSGHEYPILRSLIFKSMNELDTFENNKLPALEDLIINGENKLADICKDNLMPNLRSAQFFESYITTISCFSELKQLNSLVFFSHSLVEFNNFELPLLQNLILHNGPLKSFYNNTLHSLSYLSIEIIDGQRIKLDSFKNIKFIDIFGPLKMFSNHQLPVLSALKLSVNNEAVQFVNNTLVSLKQMKLIGFKNVPNFSLNNLGSVKILHIQSCYSQFSFQNTFRDSLNELVIAQSNLIQFINQDLPALQSLHISSGNLSIFKSNFLPKVSYMQLKLNQLTSFSCPNESSLDSLLQLYLNDNQLTDLVVDNLIFCNLKELRNLELQNNNIRNKKGAVQKLQAKYPYALIVL